MRLSDRALVAAGVALVVLMAAVWVLYPRSTRPEHGELDQVNRLGIEQRPVSDLGLAVSRAFPSS